jgi:hypothetical protein
MASLRPAPASGSPYPIAGRSPPPSRLRLTRICLRCLERIRCAIHGCAGQIRRLPGYGEPEASSTGKGRRGVTPAVSPSGSPRREPKGICVVFRHRGILSAYASGFRWGGSGLPMPSSGLGERAQAWMPKAKRTRREPRPGGQSCSARRLRSRGASVPLAVGQASACHAGTRPIRLGATPYRLAGRSLRPSWASLTRMCLRSGIHAYAGHIRRLNGRGYPSPPPLE